MSFIYIVCDPSSGSTPSTPTIYDNGNSGTAATIDWSRSNLQQITLDNDCTFTFTNPTEGQSCKLYIIQDGVGGHVITWPSLTWDKNVEPTWSTLSGILNIAFLDYFGSAWVGAGWTPV